MLYVNTWKNAFLGAGNGNVEDLEEIVTMCRPIWDLDHEQSCKEIMAQLEGYVTSGDYQEALDLLGLELDSSRDLLLTITKGGI